MVHHPTLDRATSLHPSDRAPGEGRAARAIVLAAGGTGGHIYPAEALAAELRARGLPVILMTDARSGAVTGDTLRQLETHVLPGAGIAGRGVIRGAAAMAALTLGARAARRILRQLRPAVVVAFGGYPAIAPVLAARALRNRPAIVLHEQNAVLGRANRALTRFADHLALGMDGTLRLPARPASSVTGNPVRPAIQALAGTPYDPPLGPIALLITGGSLGARVFSDVVPAAIAQLPAALRARLRITQQCRAEDEARVRAAYAALGIEAELAPFFADLPARLAAAHFVIARAGASTVAELAAIGRPALLVPLPAAIDNHQAYNAASLGADTMDQAAFTPAALATLLAARLTDSHGLIAMAHTIATHGRPDAARTLASLVLHLGKITP